MMKTVGSRRISSASASLIACANVISRVAALTRVDCDPSPLPFSSRRGKEDEGCLGVDMLIHLVGIGVRSRQGEGHRLL